jgi:hypothetical protein
MHKLILGTATAFAITLTGLQGTALAATPEATTTITRQATVFIENDTEDNGGLSNMPQISTDDADNDG